FSWTDLVVVPSETMGALDPSVAARTSFYLRTDAAASNDIVKRLVNARLTARHPGVDDFTIYDFSSAMATFKGVLAGMEFIVAILAGIALFVGGVGVMNMM